MNPSAAGIDCGSDEHYVAVPEDRDPQPVRRFGAFTADLIALAAWLQACRIDTVAIESTGVYWIPLYEILEAHGIEVKVVDPRRLAQVPGRKTDVLDCQRTHPIKVHAPPEKAPAPQPVPPHPFRPTTPIRYSVPWEGMEDFIDFLGFIKSTRSCEPNRC